MEHVLFAKFPDQARVAAAIESVQRGGAKVVTHRGVADRQAFEQIVQHSGVAAETDLRHALVVGITSGGVVGCAFGALLSAIAIFPGTLGQGAVFGALMGVLVGFVMMSIFGSGLMDGRLRRLIQTLHRGDVVVTVHAPDRPTCDQVREVLLQNGAVVVEKSPL